MMADLVEGAWGEVAVTMARKIALRKLAGCCSAFSCSSLEINTRAMSTFRKVRQLLLTSFDDGDISEDEFLLLYDVNRSKNPDFPYQN